MMFRLGVSDHVMIAHSFPDEFFGPAQRLHGATYGVEIEVRVAELGPHQVVMDIGLLRTILRRVLDEIDYRNLDEHPAFAGRFSTSERVAEHIANRVADEIGELAGSLSVLVRESPVAYAAYERSLG
jgi:6-pyruvoyltetrahydropterin/6-carboxytetrahydropterin synthase